MSTGVERGRTLEAEGLKGARARWNLAVPALYEEAVRRGEGLISRHGPLVCRTSPHTGRSPNDKFIVRDVQAERTVAWGAINRPMSEGHFQTLRRDLVASLDSAELLVQECYAGADAQFRLPIRVITQYAWHSLFARNLFLPGDDPSPAPEFTVIDAPGFRADPARHGSQSDVVIAVSFAERLVLIGGTSYAGEIKKSIFTILNYLLPLRDVLSMHCSANIGRANDVALFFGLSGTGKTTLSSDPERRLIGDDEHGWSDRGVFNFEGGCYAKTIRLSAEAEPQIWAAARRFGTVLENVVVEEDTRELNFDDDRYTEISLDE
jgi:phosphoenolpyruvate carboxykinase (ATP)